MLNIPLGQTLVTYFAFTAIIIMRYFLIVWPIHWALWRRPADKVKARRLSKREPTAATIRNEIKLSTISAFIYAAPAAIVLEMWKAGGTAMYAGDHRSVQPTPWASFSFDPIEAVSAAWLLPVMALFIPIHVGTALALLMIMTINAVFNHAGWEVYPDKWVKGWWGKHIITASHHNLHHTKFKGNYGLYFRFWDKVCGTDKGLV